MTATNTYSNFIEVNARFTRSVAIAKDFVNQDALGGYIVTPVAKAILGRVGSALCDDTSTRAWSLTGPYGSGKSAFGLLLAQSLGGEIKSQNFTKKLLEEDAPEIFRHMFGTTSSLNTKNSKLLPVLVTGSRQSLEKSLAKKLAESLRELISRGRVPKVIEELEAIASSEKPVGNRVAGLFEIANNEYLPKLEGEIKGIILIIDELGKFLEYGATYPDQGDVYILQELAEIATRSKRPFFVVTILHQAMDRYTDQMAPSKRAEWAKVQGRFEDIAFEERDEQIIRLTARAINHRKQGENSRVWQKQAFQIAQGFEQLKINLSGFDPANLIELLADCFPLHPLTALIAGPLFRNFAQSERSLFAFLASGDRHGFQEFLENNEFNPKIFNTFRVDNLFDYIAHTVGQNTSGSNSRVWHEIQTALERLSDVSSLEMRVAKTIGALQLLGSRSPIDISDATLRFALKEIAEKSEIDKAIENLRNASLVVFRKHLNSFVLWEGSDIDVPAKLEEAKRHVRQDQPLAEFLSYVLPPQPLVAKRHYFKKGTLRYFAVRYADSLNLEKIMENIPDDADGLVVLCLPMNNEEKKSMMNALNTASLIAGRPVLGAIPSGLVDLRSLCNEVLSWRWVFANTPELHTDRVARKEMQERLEYCEKIIRSQLQWAFQPQPTHSAYCEWIHAGKKQVFKQARQLNNYLSTVCDTVYSNTPVWRNELINRQNLSSSASAARRDLIAKMVENPEKELLGIQGHPPERTIYETLLLESKLHRKKNGEWGFYAPDSKTDEATCAIWQAIENFFEGSEQGRLPVNRLFQTLRLPPFGLKDGPLPVLLAAALIHFDSEVAIYEDGTFQAKLSEAIFERFFHAPEKFEVQRFRIAGPRIGVFSRYAALLQTKKTEETIDLLGLVKPLVRFAKGLPDYVHKTKKISNIAQVVLRSLREARQPDHLLFAELPIACGFLPFQATGSVNDETLDKFIETLRGTLGEIQRCYPHLLTTIEKSLLANFELAEDFTTAKKDLSNYAGAIISMSVDLKLKGFLLRAMDEGTDRNSWVEALATLLASRPPVAWDDNDFSRFETNLISMARTYRHFKLLAFEAGKSQYCQGTTFMRLSISKSQNADAEKVLAITPEMQAKIDSLKKEIRQWMAEQEMDIQNKLGLAAFTQIARDLMMNLEGKN